MKRARNIAKRNIEKKQEVTRAKGSPWLTVRHRWQSV